MFIEIEKYVARHDKSKFTWLSERLIIELSNLAGVRHEAYSFTVGTNEQMTENKYLVEMEA